MSPSVSHYSRDLTRGPLLSSLLWFSLPILIGNLFQQLYNIVDTAAVSHRGRFTRRRASATNCVTRLTASAGFLTV